MDAPRGGVDVSFEGDIDECIKWGLFPFNIQDFKREPSIRGIGELDDFYI